MDTEWWNVARGVDWVSITSTAIQSLLFLLIIVTAIASLRYVFNPRLRSYKLLLPYIISILCIILFCSLTAICSILSSIFMQRQQRASSFHLVGFTLLFYNASLSSSYLLFIHRLHLMLKTSVYEISIIARSILFALAFLMVCVQVVILYYVASSKVQYSHNWEVIDTLSFVSMCIFYVGSTAVILLFITKLKLLLTNPDCIDLADSITKVSLLILVSVFTSIIIWMLLTAEWAFKDSNRFITYFFDVFVVIDATVNMLCMHCSFPFGEKLYDKLFGNLHGKLKNWCRP